MFPRRLLRITFSVYVAFLAGVVCKNYLIRIFCCHGVSLKERNGMTAFLKEVCCELSAFYQVKDGLKEYYGYHKKA